MDCFASLAMTRMMGLLQHIRAPSSRSISSAASRAQEKYCCKLRAWYAGHRLKETVDRHCPVLDILRNPTPVALKLRTSSSSVAA